MRRINSLFFHASPKNASIRFCSTQETRQLAPLNAYCTHKQSARCVILFHCFNEEKVVERWPTRVMGFNTASSGVRREVRDLSVGTSPAQVIWTEQCIARSVHHQVSSSRSGPHIIITRSNFVFFSYVTNDHKFEHDRIIPY